MSNQVLMSKRECYRNFIITALLMLFMAIANGITTCGLIHEIDSLRDRVRILESE